jgi:hypothetical protein
MIIDTSAWPKCHICGARMTALTNDQVRTFHYSPELGEASKLDAREMAERVTFACGGSATRKWFPVDYEEEPPYPNGELEMNSFKNWRVANYCCHSQTILESLRKTVGWDESYKLDEEQAP